MLTLRPEQRITVQQALQHPWINDQPFPTREERLLAAGIVPSAGTTSAKAKGKATTTRKVADVSVSEFDQYLNQQQQI